MRAGKRQLVPQSLGRGWGLGKGGELGSWVWLEVWIPGALGALQNPEPNLRLCGLHLQSIRKDAQTVSLESFWTLAYAFSYVTI